MSSSLPFSSASRLDSPNAEPRTPSAERDETLPLYTPLLWRHINPFMEVDFQAIKLEELKSRLGELRRYL
jgi:hypothetical protein